MGAADILDLVRADGWRMSALRAARTLGLPNWMIGAGFVRSKVWDHLHGITRDGPPPGDIDLIYYDAAALSTAREQRAEAALKSLFPADWSVRNQARMHLHNGRDLPYRSIAEAVADWPETATAVAVTLTEAEALHLLAPCGIGDLTGLIIRPAGNGLRNPEIYRRRKLSKGWEKHWPKLVWRD